MAPHRLLMIGDHPFGMTWVIDEPMQRASHALLHGRRVWYVDPVDVPAALNRAAQLGEPGGVIQLLDRHNRDCAELAERLGVPHVKVPHTLPGTPFEVVRVVDLPGWREIALWWRDQEVLVVAEAVGSGPMFAPDDVPAGVHLFLRVWPPRALRGYAPRDLLFGHGPPLQAPEADGALDAAYRRSLRDLPRTLRRIPAMMRG